MLIDAHAHLFDYQDKIKTIRIIELTENENWTAVNDFYFAGIHPKNVDLISLSKIKDRLEACHKDKYFGGVGEIGLDKFYQNIKKQKEILISQLEFAQKYNYPVQIHCVKMFQELYSIITKFPDIQYIFHSFNGALEQMKKLHHLNITYSLSYRSICSKHIDNVLPIIVKGRKFVLESDADSQIKKKERKKTLEMILDFVMEKSGLTRQEVLEINRTSIKNWGEGCAVWLLP